MGPINPEHAIFRTAPMATHLLLDGTQVGQHHAEAHGNDEHQGAADGLAKAAQQHSIQRCHVRPVARGVEVDIVKVPAVPPGCSL